MSTRFSPVSSPWSTPFDGSLRLADLSTTPPEEAPSAKKCKKELGQVRERLADLQRVLYAHDCWAVLTIFQAMDAAGKDGTIRHVFGGMNPAGFQVSSFKRPSANELDHDYLWRTNCALPQRGRIGVFNRSYYEEVLAVRTHPQFLKYQKLPVIPPEDELWTERFESIRDHELHLARNGVLVLKFWLNVSKKEQKNRFLARLDEPEKNWKFEPNDVVERGFWAQYQTAYEELINATSRPWAPWFAIPADDKPFMRLAVAQIIEESLMSLDLAYPEVSPEKRSEFAESRRQLESEDS